MEAAARAAAGGGDAEAPRCPALSGLRGAGVAAVTEPEEEKGGGCAAGPRTPEGTWTAIGPRATGRGW